MRQAIRVLLFAALLAGALIPNLAYGYAEMYTYSSLTRDGTDVYGYAAVSLAYPVEHCGSMTTCWDWYDSTVSIILQKDSQWRGSSYDYQYCYYAEAWVSADADTGSWDLSSSFWLDVGWEYWPFDEFEYGYYYEDFLSSSSSDYLTINPEILISSAQTVDDGDEAYFDVTVELGTPTAFGWSYDNPSGAGNNPDVDFSDPYSDSTNTNAHWFAYPNIACTSDSATYDITATVGFQNGSLSDTTDLTVLVPWAPGGQTTPPTLIPHVYYDFVNGLWRVLPQTYFVRTNPFVYLNVPSTSQFRNKVATHEFFHQDQYMPGGSSHLNEDLWNPTDARNAVITLTNATEAGLNNLIEGALNSYLAAQAYMDQQRGAEAEAEAHAVSDPIAPMYLYQASCN